MLSSTSGEHSNRKDTTTFQWRLFDTVQGFSASSIKFREACFEIFFYSADGSNEDFGNWAPIIGPCSSAQCFLSETLIIWEEQCFSEQFRNEGFFENSDIRRDVNGMHLSLNGQQNSSHVKRKIKTKETGIPENGDAKDCLRLQGQKYDVNYCPCDMLMWS